MKTSPSRRILFWIAVSAMTLSAAACILNPQPLPPEATDGRGTSSSSGGSTPSPGDASQFTGDSGGSPNNDAAIPPVDGSTGVDASVDAGGDASGDASYSDAADAAD